LPSLTPLSRQNPNQTSLTVQNNNVIRPNNAKTRADREPIGRTSALEEGSNGL